MRFLLLPLFVSLSSFLAVPGAAPPADDAAPVSVQLLAINDFHGNLEPPSGDNGLVHTTPAGGAEYLATHLKLAAAANPNTILVAAGDLVGASPLVSAVFHDEPTIEAMNAANLAIASVGNHEFDDGPMELLRLQHGGCYAGDPCRERFAGARFQYLAANVLDTATGAPLLPATAVRTFDGVKVGFIGETLQGTNRIVVPSSVEGLRFLDEASTANVHAAALKRQGVHAIVLLIHEGGRQRPEDSMADPNGCAGFSGAIARIAGRLSADIKVVISGHTHRFYNCTIAGHTVTSAGSFGRLYTRLVLSLDRSKGTILGVQATNHIVTRTVDKDPEQTAIIAKYGALAAPIADRVVGATTGSITRSRNRAGESSLGDVIADAQLTAARAALAGGAAVVFMNSGGIRADLVPRGPSGSVHYGDLFTIQPFSNIITTVTLTGDEIRQLLEQQFDNPREGQNTFLQVSEGFAYRYRLAAKPGRRLVGNSITIDGRIVKPHDRVRVSANNFLIDGGDNFTVFRRGTNRLNGPGDLDALMAYFAAHSPVRPGAQDRMTRVD